MRQKWIDYLATAAAAFAMQYATVNPRLSRWRRERTGDRPLTA